MDISIKIYLAFKPKASVTLPSLAVQHLRGVRHWLFDCGLTNQEVLSRLYEPKVVKNQPHPHFLACTSIAVFRLVLD